MIYELHRKTTFFIYVVDFYILLKYGIATLGDFVNEKQGSTNQSRDYPFSLFFWHLEKIFLQWQKYQISFLFVINIFYPTYFIQTFKFAKKTNNKNKIHLSIHKLYAIFLWVLHSMFDLYCFNEVKRCGIGHFSVVSQENVYLAFHRLYLQMKTYSKAYL